MRLNTGDIFMKSKMAASISTFKRLPIYVKECMLPKNCLESRGMSTRAKDKPIPLFLNAHGILS